MPVTRIPIFRNPSYKANGLKSYIYALHKFGITPNKGTLVTRDGDKRLMMKAADGTQNEVTADNQQNDAFYTSPIQIGTPAQSMPVVSRSPSSAS